VKEYGVFLEAQNGVRGLCHVSQLTVALSSLAVGDPLRAIYTGEGPRGHGFKMPPAPRAPPRPRQPLRE